MVVSYCYVSMGGRLDWSVAKLWAQPRNQYTACESNQEMFHLVHVHSGVHSHPRILKHRSSRASWIHGAPPWTPPRRARVPPKTVGILSISPWRRPCSAGRSRQPGGRSVTSRVPRRARGCVRLAGARAREKRWSRNTYRPEAAGCMRPCVAHDRSARAWDMLHHACMATGPLL